MNELDPKSRALIDAALAEALPEPGVGRKVLSRIVATIEAGPPGGGGEPSGTPAPAAATPAATTSVAVKVATILVPLAAVCVGVVAGAAYLGRDREHPAASTTAAAPINDTREVGHESEAVVTPPVPARVQQIAAVRGVPTNPARKAPDQPAAARKRPKPASATPTSAAPASTTPTSVATPETLLAELTAVAGARRALRRGKSARALAAAQKYQSHYPGGQLTDEAVVIEVLALCALGQTEAATSRRALFAKRFPQSLQQGKLVNSCAVSLPRRPRNQ